MAIDLKIPSIGESITEVQISEWLKSEGDMVKKDETVAVIDSEKSTLDLPAPENGRLAKILHQAGATVKVGEVVAQIEPADAAEKDKKDKTAETKTKAEPKAEAAPEETKEKEKISAPAEKKQNESKESPAPQKPESSPTPRPSPVEASEPAEKTETKSVSHPSPETSAKISVREQKSVPMTMLRRTAARRLVEAKQQMAMLATFNEVDMTAVQSLRKEHQEAFTKRHQTKLGIMSFFVKAAVDALKQFPQLNAEVRGEEIVNPNYFDIGVAIASERGLVVPVLRNAEKMNFEDVEKAIGDFAKRAKDGKLKPDELAGGTFTITNGGVFGSLFSTPIINPPQSGILGLHTIQERPIAVAGQVVIRPMMYVALTYDHRIVDGREAVLFLHRIKEAIENPARMLIGI